MKAYNEIFQNYKEKDYTRQVPKTEFVEQWFLPHFPVVKEERVTTKVHVVFDAAAEHDGKSLNDTMWPGPELRRELVDVLTRSRRAPVALSADISGMFLQVELQDKDRPFHRFLWRDFDMMSMSFNVYCLETLPRHFVHSMSFTPMPGFMLWSSLKQQEMLKSRCM